MNSNSPRSWILICSLQVVFQLKIATILASFHHRLVFYNIGNGIKLNAEPIRVVAERHGQDCIRLCMKCTGCMSINIHFHSLKSVHCHLLPVDQVLDPRNFENVSDWQYMDTRSVQDKIGSYCQSLPSNPCPCERCVDNSQTSGNYSCKPYGSCKDLLQSRKLVESYCKIKPSFIKAVVLVKCVSINTKVWTIFKHRSDVQISVNGFENRGSFRHDFIYEVLFKDIVAFIDQSIHCQQWTWLNCFGSVLFFNDVGWLTNRDGKKMSYFGGGPANGTGCACGLTNTCLNNKYQCNCDSNVMSGAIDKGFVTKKGDLPIKAINLGDTGGTDEHSLFRLGHLMCYNG